MLHLQKRRAALTHLDHIAILDYSPQQFPVFCLILLLFQVGSMLFMEKEDRSQEETTGSICLQRCKTTFTSSNKNPRNKQTPKDTLRLSDTGKAFKNPTHLGL